METMLLIVMLESSSECSAPAPDAGAPFRSPHFIPLTFASGKRVLLDIKRPKRDIAPPASSHAITTHQQSSSRGLRSGSLTLRPVAQLLQELDDEVCITKPTYTYTPRENGLATRCVVAIPMTHARYEHSGKHDPLNLCLSRTRLWLSHSPHRSTTIPRARACFGSTSTHPSDSTSSSAMKYVSIRHQHQYGGHHRPLISVMMIVSHILRCVQSLPTSENQP